MTNPKTLERTMTPEQVAYAKKCARGRVIVIDDEPEILKAYEKLFNSEGYACETYMSAATYLNITKYNTPIYHGPICILCDVKMPDIDGIDLKKNVSPNNEIPFVFMSGRSGSLETRNAFHVGAVDFLLKPIEIIDLINAIEKALAISENAAKKNKKREEFSGRVSQLSIREKDVIRKVLTGSTNQSIAEELGVSLRTIKLHRQHAIQKLNVDNIQQIVRLEIETGVEI
jgi:two-component system response regulator FixJ